MFLNLRRFKIQAVTSTQKTIHLQCKGLSMPITHKVFVVTYFFLNISSNDTNQKNLKTCVLLLRDQMFRFFLCNLSLKFSQGNCTLILKMIKNLNHPPSFFFPFDSGLSEKQLRFTRTFSPKFHFINRV